MARKRYLSPKFFGNEALTDLDPLARILFLGLLCLADRNGRLEYRPKSIKGQILPYESTIEKVAEWLEELAQKRVVQFYEVQQQRYIEIINFSKYQSPHPEEKALYPGPNKNNLLASGKKASGNWSEIADKVASNGLAVGQQVASSLEVAEEPLPESDLPDIEAKIRDGKVESRLRVIAPSTSESATSENHLPATCQQLSSNLPESYQQSFNSNYNFNSNYKKNTDTVPDARAHANATAVPPCEEKSDFDPKLEKIEKLEALVIQATGIQPMNSSLEGRIRRTVGEINDAGIGLDDFTRFVRTRYKPQSLNYILVNFLKWQAEEGGGTNGHKQPNAPSKGTLSGNSRQGEAGGSTTSGGCFDAEEVI